MLYLPIAHEAFEGSITRVVKVVRFLNCKEEAQNTRANSDDKTPFGVGSRTVFTSDGLRSDNYEFLYPYDLAIFYAHPVRTRRQVAYIQCDTAVALKEVIAAQQ